MYHRQQLLLLVWPYRPLLFMLVKFIPAHRLPTRTHTPFEALCKTLVCGLEGQERAFVGPIMNFILDGKHIFELKASAFYTELVTGFLLTAWKDITDIVRQNMEAIMKTGYICKRQK